MPFYAEHAKFMPWEKNLQYKKGNGEDERIILLGEMDFCGVNTK